MGAIHQGATFPPQLSLVSAGGGGPATLTINGFPASPSNSSNAVAPITGVLLQEYHQGATSCSTVQPTAATCPTTVNALIVQQGSPSSPLTTATTSGAGNFLTTSSNHHKKREAFTATQGQPVKLENKPCVCMNNNGSSEYFLKNFVAALMRCGRSLSPRVCDALTFYCYRFAYATSTTILLLRNSPNFQRGLFFL